MIQPCALSQSESFLCKNCGRNVISGLEQRGVKVSMPNGSHSATRVVKTEVDLSLMRYINRSPVCIVIQHLDIFSSWPGLDYLMNSCGLRGLTKVIGTNYSSQRNLDLFLNSCGNCLFLAKMLFTAPFAIAGMFAVIPYARAAKKVLQDTE